MPHFRVGMTVGRPHASSRTSPHTPECNTYRVAIFHALWPFRGHELAGPRSTEHSGPETQSRPQPRGASPSCRGQPWSHGQDRERQVRCLARSFRTHRTGAERRPGGAIREAVRSIPNLPGGSATNRPETVESHKLRRAYGDPVACLAKAARPVNPISKEQSHSPNPEGKT